MVELKKKHQTSKWNEYINESRIIKAHLSFKWLKNQCLQSPCLFGKSSVSKFSCNNKICLSVIVYVTIYPYLNYQNQPARPSQFVNLHWILTYVCPNWTSVESDWSSILYSYWD